MGYLKKIDYRENMIKILISNIDRIFAYWNISEDYNNEFKKKYGEDFFEKTKEVLILRNLRNNKDVIIEIEQPTNNYYIKFDYANSIYQVILTRIGKEDNKDYGYKLISNKIQSPNIKILINSYSTEKVKFKNVKDMSDLLETKYYKIGENKKIDIDKLYNKHIIPSWDEYKKENGYREK